MKGFSLNALCLFPAIWSGLAFYAKHHQATDVDLGISTSLLSVWDCLLWTLPAAMVCWGGVIIGSKLAVWIVRLLSGPQENPSKRVV